MRVSRAAAGDAAAGAGQRLGPIDELVLFDNAPPALPLPDDKRLRLVTGDIADRDTVAAADRTRHRRGLSPRRDRQRRGRGEHRSRLPGQSRRHPRRARCLPRARQPRRALVFASSLAVYGGALPPAVGDDTALTPQTSYGTQKAIGELAGQRLQPQGLYRRPRAAPADRGRAARPAQPRRLDLCLLDHPRAARRAGCGVPGRRPRR